MFQECSPPIPVARLVGLSGSGDSVGSVEAAPSNYIQEITFLGSSFMWKNSAVCGGRIWLKCFGSVWSDLWKSRDRESAMIFSVPLMCCEFMHVSLLTSVHPIQRATASCDSEFTESKYALCIPPSVLELSVNAKMCDPCSIFSMIM